MNGSLAKALLEPTPIWIKQLEIQRIDLGVKFASHAHITGGGLLENIPRVLPDDCKVVLDRNAWKRPPIFPLIQRQGNVDSEEMDRTFNQGIMVVSIVADEGHSINTPKAIEIGQVEKRNGDEPQVQLTGTFNDN